MWPLLIMLSNIKVCLAQQTLTLHWKQPIQSSPTVDYLMGKMMYPSADILRVDRDNIPDKTGTNVSTWELDKEILPEFVRKNPSGYSYLCRLERKIEKKAPLGIWMRVGEVNAWEYYNRQNMYVQLKIFGFK